MASRFGGFAAVDAMSYQDYQLARQLIAEERVGTLVRQSAQHEDRAFAASRDAVQRMNRNG